MSDINPTDLVRIEGPLVLQDLEKTERTYHLILGDRVRVETNKSYARVLCLDKEVTYKSWEMLHNIQTHEGAHICWDCVEVAISMPETEA